MSNKHSRSGGKFNGNHTTLIPAACCVADIAESCTAVTKISPGFIKAGLKSVNGIRRVKITDDKLCLLLSVRDNTSHQEIRIYVNDIQAAKRTIIKGAKSAGLNVSFGGEKIQRSHN